MAAIKATPVGESGGYLQMPFFRDDRRHITLIQDGQAVQFNNDHGAAELVRRTLQRRLQRSERTMTHHAIEFKATEFPTASEAIQWRNAGGQDKAVLLDGKNLVMAQSEADRLAAAGVEFAYLCDHEMPDGTHRIMTVPVN